MDPRDRALLLFVVGIVLVLNPVYLFPNGVPHEKPVTYRAEVIERPDPYASSVPGYAILDCSSEIHHRACVQAKQVGYNGSTRVDDAAFHLHDEESGLYTDYEYVRFREGYAKPNATGRNGTLVLSYEPRTTEAVMSEYAYQYSDLPPVGKRAIQNGTTTTTRRIVDFGEYEPVLEEYQEFVERNGTFYAISRGPGRTRPVVPEWLFGAGRIGGVVGGAALAFVGAGRHARQTDEDHSGFGPWSRER